MSGSVGRVAVGAIRMLPLSQAGGTGSAAVLQPVAIRTTSNIKDNTVFISNPDWYCP